MPFGPQITQYNQIKIQKPFQSSNSVSLLILKSQKTAFYRLFGKKKSLGGINNKSEKLGGIRH